MSGFSFRTKGSTKHLENFLHSMSHLDIASIVEPYAQRGVAALSNATPVDTGLAADSWDYKIETSGNTVSIIWTNTDVENGFPVVIMLQYGHGTGTGGYVQGRDFINPAIKPIFDGIADAVWKVVTSS